MSIRSSYSCHLQYSFTHSFAHEESAHLSLCWILNRTVHHAALLQQSRQRSLQILDSEVEDRRETCRAESLSVRNTVSADSTERLLLCRLTLQLLLER